MGFRLLGALRLEVEDIRIRGPAFVRRQKGEGGKEFKQMFKVTINKQSHLNSKPT